MALTLFAYVITAFIIKEDWGKVLYETFVPSFSISKGHLTNIVTLNK